MGYSYFNPLNGQTNTYASDAEAQAANAAVYHHFGHSYVPIYHADGARTTEAPQPAPVNLVDPNDPVWQASQGTISATQPTLMDSLTGAIHRGLSGMGISDQSAQRTADQTGDLLGATPVGAVSEALRGAGAAYHNFMHGRPDEGLGAAAGASLAALGAIPGEGEAADVAENAAGDAIRAWHGSPHDFDQFDMSKIGTGEGAQAYGHGLYFASNPDVAKDYRVGLSGPPSYIPNDPQSVAHDQVGKYLSDGKPLDRAKKIAALDFKQDIDLANEYSSIAPGAHWQDMIDRAQKGLSDLDNVGLDGFTKKDAGHLYEVNINAHPDHFLDWDAPLGSQPVAEKFANSVDPPFSDMALKDALATDRTGKQFVTNYHEFRSPEEVAARLSAAGIPGIKYLDQGSRGAGNGTHNYVVFDPAHIEILRKLGLLGLLGAGGMAAMPQSNPQAGT